MTIYIPEFWCGVGATFLAEFVAIFVYAFVSIERAKRNKANIRKGDK